MKTAEIRMNNLPGLETENEFDNLRPCSRAPVGTKKGSFAAIGLA